MSGKEAKRMRKMKRGAVEAATRAQVVVITEKAKRVLRHSTLQKVLIALLLPANVYFLYWFLKGLFN